jgi:galactoside 2-L-fucosyltransferase 1/2
LGNQLFQFASVLGIYEDRKRRNPYGDAVVLCVDRDHRFLALEQIFSGPFPLCPEHMPPTKHLWEKGYGIFTRFDETQFCSTENACAFTFGPYLQSYKYLQLGAKSVRAALQFKSKGLADKAMAITHKARTNPTTALVGIHIRRTDILQLDYLQEATTNYLQNAMHHFQAEFGGTVRFLIVSDDVAWCQQQALFEHADIVVNSNNDPILDLAIMSHCDHMILSVGSFGWWGAWLGMAEDVVYNRQAIVLEHATNRGQVRLEDYYPKMWKGIPV